MTTHLHLPVCPERPDGEPHCWHDKPGQHLTEPLSEYVMEDKCCFCGTIRRLTVKPVSSMALALKRVEHGPHAWTWS